MYTLPDDWYIVILQEYFLNKWNLVTLLPFPCSSSFPSFHFLLSIHELFYLFCKYLQKLTAMTARLLIENLWCTRHHGSRAMIVPKKWRKTNSNWVPPLYQAWCQALPLHQSPTLMTTLHSQHCYHYYPHSTGPEILRGQEVECPRWHR